MYIDQLKGNDNLETVKLKEVIKLIWKNNNFEGSDFSKKLPVSKNRNTIVTVIFVKVNYQLLICFVLTELLVS